MLVVFLAPIRQGFYHPCLPQSIFPWKLNGFITGVIWIYTTTPRYVVIKGTHINYDRIKKEYAVSKNLLELTVGNFSNENKMSLYVPKIEINQFIARLSVFLLIYLAIWVWVKPINKIENEEDF